MQLGYRLTNSLGKPSKCPGLHHWVLWVTLPPSPSQTAATCPPPLPAALLVLSVLLFVLKQIITMLMLSAPSSPSHLEPLFYLKATLLLLLPPSRISSAGRPFMSDFKMSPIVLFRFLAVRFLHQGDFWALEMIKISVQCLILQMRIGETNTK